MSDWHCYTCKVVVEQEDVEVQFLDFRFFCAGLVCPTCQEKWLTEEVVVEEVRPPEGDAKAKMASRTDLMMRRVDHNSAKRASLPAGDPIRDWRTA